MRTVDEYLDHAKKRGDITSDRQLGRILGVGPGTVTQYRTKRIWPAEAVMIKLADICGLDPVQALMHLGQWKTDGDVKKAYEKAEMLLALADQIEREQAGNKGQI